LFDLSFGILVTFSLLNSAIAHDMIVLNKGRFIVDLKMGLYRFRWFEYALSSSIMIVLIAIFLYMGGTGNYDQVPWFVKAIFWTYSRAF
jgi:hypothetical protein